MDDSDVSEQASDTASQVREIFDAVEIAGSIGFEEFKHFLDHVPIAVIVSKSVRGEQRIVYANKAFEALTGQELGKIKGRNWSVLDAFRNEDDPEVTLGHALLTDDDSIGIPIA